MSVTGKNKWAIRKQSGTTLASNHGVPHTEETKQKMRLKAKDRLKGVPKSEAHRQAMKEATARRLTGQTEIVTPIGIFNDLLTAATALEITLGSLKYRLIQKRDEYFYKKLLD